MRPDLGVVGLGGLFCSESGEVLKITDVISSSPIHFVAVL
jgi:hypothetical protein